MPCEECERYAASKAWARCDPACLRCGGRYLFLIQRLRLPEQEKRERLRAAVTVWTDLGHPESQLREIAAAMRKA